MSVESCWSGHEALKEPTRTPVRVSSRHGWSQDLPNVSFCSTCAHFKQTIGGQLLEFEHKLFSHNMSISAHHSQRSMSSSAHAIPNAGIIVAVFTIAYTCHIGTPSLGCV